ncbi:hypothetical protein WJX77_008168 [Trebouxia sp. C0004]
MSNLESDLVITMVLHMIIGAGSKRRHHLLSCEDRPKPEDAAPLKLLGLLFLLSWLAMTSLDRSTGIDWAAGVVITGTGFFGRHRQHIRHMVQSSGGTYSGDLLLEFTTHLVYKDLSIAEQGEKYATAKSWGIPVLPFSWLQDSAEGKKLLPSTYRLCTPQQEAAFPSLKLQQLCLQDHLPSTTIIAQGPLHTSVCPSTDQDDSGSVKVLQDASSQVRGLSMLHSTDPSHERLNEASNLMSCHGSFDPAEPEPPLNNAQDADNSETCSNRSDLADCEAAHQSSDPDAPIEDQPPTTSDDLIIPDSQPDDSLPSCADQAVMPVTALVAEAQSAGAEPADKIQGQATSFISDSPLECTAACSSRAEYEQTRSSSCSTVAETCCSSGHSDQQPFPEQSAFDASATSPTNSCEAVPDTELQTSPSISVPAQLSLSEVRGTSSSYIMDCTSTIGPADLESQGSPGTSYASRAFVIEDSDSESDFQPLKPTRPSTSSFHNSAQATCRPGGHHMLQLGQTGDSTVAPLKLMSRYPRGTSVKERHGLASLKGVQFAEQLQVHGVLLSTKDKKICAVLSQDANQADQENLGAREGIKIAEVQALYQLSAGDWYIEYLPFFSASQVQAAQATIGYSALPSGTDHQQELFRGVHRLHAKIGAVNGSIAVRRSKVSGPIKKSRPTTGFFWRASFDTASLQIVSDRPVTDFVE